MANPEHLAKLKEGVEAWNQWRVENPEVEPDLAKANFYGDDLVGANLSWAYLYGTVFTRANLSGVDFVGSNLHRARLNEANLRRANLSDTLLGMANLLQAKLQEAKLTGTDLAHATLIGADLTRADLSNAKLIGANLVETDLHGADLSNANLSSATLIATNLEGANLTGCSVYGISAWDVRLEGAIQSNLVITPSGRSAIQVDNLEVAQFVYLLLNNERIRHVIDTITSKVVLILGRFTDERKAVLDAIRDELRKRDYLPVLFDFEKPDSKDLTGTVTTLANMARFIIADLTDPSSVPHELASIIPTTPVAVQTIILKGQKEYTMFADLKQRYRWVLNPYRYDTQEMLLGNLDAKVITPAEAKARALMPKSRRSP